MSDAIPAPVSRVFKTWDIPSPSPTARLTREFNLGDADRSLVTLSFFAPGLGAPKFVWDTHSNREAMQICRPSDESGYLLRIDGLMPDSLLSYLYPDTPFYTITEYVVNGYGLSVRETGEFVRPS